MTAFFAWLAWAAGTNRPGARPHLHHQLALRPAGRQPRACPTALIWSIVSVILLILGRRPPPSSSTSATSATRARRRKPVTALPEPAAAPPASKATLAYFVVAIVLFVLQVVLGSLTGHFTVEGNELLRLRPSAKILPYAAVRTWHLQLAVFLIATCLLATGLFIGPCVGPRAQAPGQARLGAVRRGGGGGAGRALRHLRCRSPALFGGDGFAPRPPGLRVHRARPRLADPAHRRHDVLAGAGGARHPAGALAAEKDNGGLTHLCSTAPSPSRSSTWSGLMYGKGSHISDAEYWRWWVVHLWVEGFFEVFATVVHGLPAGPHRRGRRASSRCARSTSASSSTWAPASSAPSTTSTGPARPPPSSRSARVFSALEVVPLTLVGFEAVSQPASAKAGGIAQPLPLAASTSSCRWRSGTCWARACSASSSTRPSSSTTSRASTRRPSTRTPRSSASTACSPSRSCSSRCATS